MTKKKIEITDERKFSFERKNIKWVVSAILAIVLIWYFRPVWHELVMWIYTNPQLLEILVMGCVIGSIAWHYKSNGKFVAVCAIIFAILLVAILALGEEYANYYLSQNLQVEKIDKLPNINPAEARIQPLAVSQRYAKDALEYPQFTLGTGNIAYVNGTPNWAYGLVPNGFWNYFFKSDRGAMYVDMSTVLKNTHTIEKEMKVGEGVAITDNYLWNIYKKNYWIDIEDPVFFPADNRLYLAVPIITYEFHWETYGYLPIVFSVPRWGGTALYDSEGTLQFLNPEESQNSQILKDQILFPEHLTKKYVDSLRYKNGIWNVWTAHNEEFKLAEEETAQTIQDNQQPFYIGTVEGKKWFVGVEPWGESTHGIYRIYLIDARAGKLQQYDRPKSSMLIGPAKVVDYVRKSRGTMDWSRFTAVESLPVPRDDGLWWHTKVIPNDASGIAYTAMINAATTEVVELQTDQEIRDFLAGRGIVRPAQPVNLTATITIDNMNASIVILEGNRTIRTIEIFPNQSLVIAPR